MSAPIRVGFIGLSKVGGGWGPVAHFPYLKASPKYQIVAICNTSVESAQKAIEDFELPAETRAYGSPADLAADKDIDLVVCSVRVDRHLATITPALKAGKNVFVEWPLASNLKDAQTLLALARENNVKIAEVGLQSRLAPVIQTLKGVVQSGKVGRVLSSTWTGSAGNGGGTELEKYRYLGKVEVGGNLVQIHFGHAVDYVQSVLGYNFETPPKSLLVTTRKQIALVSSSGEVVDPAFEKETPDFITLQGTLATGIPVSLTLRGGKAFKGTQGLEWRIYGEKGEIRITASGPFLGVGYPDVKIEVHDFKSDSLEEITIVDDDSEVEGVQGPARNVARVYEKIAEGKGNCSFEDAVERHEFLHNLWTDNGYKV